MNRPQESTALLRTVVATLIGVVVTGLGAYVSLARDSVHTSDLPDAVARFSPYLPDKAAIQRQLDDTQRQADRNSNELAYLRDYVRALDTEIALLRKDIDALGGTSSSVPHPNETPRIP